MENTLSGSPYLFWMIGIVVLGAIFAFVLTRRTIRARKAVSDEATERLYESESREAEREH